MKHLLTILLIIGFCSFAQAQGNLEFNQAKYIEWGMTLTPNVSNQSVEQVIVVPAGKVWKIESASGAYIQNTTPYPSHSHSIQILLNRRLILNVLGSTEFAGNIFPIWLPAGTYTLKLVHTSNTSSSNYETVAGVSAIEFNVVP